mgnify:CR=1 FL=1
MKIMVEVSLEDFPAWSGGKETLDRLIEINAVGDVEEYLEEWLDAGENWTDTQLNDYLWFDRDGISEYLGYDIFEDVVHITDSKDDDDLDFEEAYVPQEQLVGWVNEHGGEVEALDTAYNWLGERVEYEVLH